MGDEHAAREFTVRAIGTVSCPRTEAIDDDWGPIESTIALDATRFTADVLAGLGDFSHVDVVYLFDQVDEAKVNLGARHPRGNEDWPLVGIFAQRAKARPNRLGVTTCELRRRRRADAHRARASTRSTAPRCSTSSPTWSSSRPAVRSASRRGSPS